MQSWHMPFYHLVLPLTQNPSCIQHSLHNHYLLTIYILRFSIENCISLQHVTLGDTCERHPKVGKHKSKLCLVMDPWDRETGWCVSGWDWALISACLARKDQWTEGWLNIALGVDIMSRSGVCFCVFMNVWLCEWYMDSVSSLSSSFQHEGMLEFH